MTDIHCCTAYQKLNRPKNCEFDLITVLKADLSHIFQYLMAEIRLIHLQHKITGYHHRKLCTHFLIFYLRKCSVENFSLVKDLFIFIFLCIKLIFDLS